MQISENLLINTLIGDKISGNANGDNNSERYYSDSLGFPLWSISPFPFIFQTELVRVDLTLSTHNDAN